MSISENQKERARTLVENRDIILSRREPIDGILKSTLEHQTRISEQSLVNHLGAILTSSDTNLDEGTELAGALLNFILFMGEKSTSIIEELEKNGELVKYLNLLRSKYLIHLKRYQAEKESGRYFLNNVDTELKIRRGDFIGYNHLLETRYEDEYEIHVSDIAHHQLINHLLEQSIRATNRFWEGAFQGSDQHVLEIKNKADILMEMRGVPDD